MTIYAEIWIQREAKETMVAPRSHLFADVQQQREIRIARVLKPDAPTRSQTYMRPLFSKVTPTAWFHPLAAGPAITVSVNPGGTVAAETEDVAVQRSTSPMTTCRLDVRAFPANRMKKSRTAQRQ